MLGRIGKENFDIIYKIMQESFPESERRSYEGQLRLIDREDYRIFSYNTDLNKIVGFLALYDLSDFIFLEHFAIKGSHRNMGLGAMAIKEFINLFDKPIFIEVEPPESEIAVRRIEFYKRCGFIYHDVEYTQPALNSFTEPIKLKIMSASGIFTMDDVNKYTKRILKEVYLK